ncbi:MAG: hypothetical protein KDE15_12645 [Erythrobacter sp.]|nr:hypothetical protein [Erythrobacter sp.]
MASSNANRPAQGKRAWSTPTVEVVASQADISSFAVDIDEDFTGDPLNS